MSETNLDWLDVCLPLAEQVEIETYQPTEEEIEEYYDV